jgi:Zn-dependent protease with chaperone function
MFLQAIGLLTPVMVMTVGTWSADHRYGVLLGYAESGIKNHARAVLGVWRAHLAWLVIPILMLMLAGDLLNLLPLPSAAASWLTVATIAAFVLIVLPTLVPRIFKTERLDEATDRWVHQLVAAAGLKRTRALRWNTGGRTFNALVAGFIPRFRSLLISDRLFDSLPREQVAMVVLHELAHLHRMHVPLRLLAILPAWGLSLGLTRLLGPQGWSVPIGCVAGIVSTMVVLRWLAYQTEYDADQIACHFAARVSGAIEDVPVSCGAAAEALAAALDRVTADHPASRRASWLHPGVAERVARLRRLREPPSTSSSPAGTIANPA